MTDSTKNTAPAISDAIWVAILSAATYAVAFSYESAFAKYFNIPATLITISPTLLLNAGGTLLATTIPIYAIANAVWPFLPRSETALANSVRLLVVQALCFGFLFSPYLMHGEGWGLFGGAIVFTAFFELIFPLFTQKKVPTFEQKLAEQDKIEGNAQSFSLVGKLSSRFGRAPVQFLLLLIAATSFARLLGGQEAKNKVDFFLLKGAQNVALLAQYDNIFVTQSFDPKTKALIGHLTITKLGDGKEIELVSSNVGPLIPMKLAK